jgi:hypothetical protein
MLTRNQLKPKLWVKRDVSACLQLRDIFTQKSSAFFLRKWGEKFYNRKLSNFDINNLKDYQGTHPLFPK